MRGDGGLDAIPNHERLVAVGGVFSVRGKRAGDGKAGFERETLERAGSVQASEAIIALRVGDRWQRSISRECPAHGFGVGFGASPPVVGLL